MTTLSEFQGFRAKKKGKGRYGAKRQCRCLTCGSKAENFPSITEWDFYWNWVVPRMKSGEFSDVQLHEKLEVCKGVVVEVDVSYTDLGVRHRVDVKRPGKDGKPLLTPKYKKNAKLVKQIMGIDIEIAVWKPRQKW